MHYMNRIARLAGPGLLCLTSALCTPAAHAETSSRSATLDQATHELRAAARHISEDVKHASRQLAAGARKVGHTIADTARKTGRTIADGARQTGREVKKAAHEHI